MSTIPEIIASEEERNLKKTKMGKTVFETKLRTCLGEKKEGSQPSSQTSLSHNNLTMKFG